MLRAPMGITSPLLGIHMHSTAERGPDLPLPPLLPFEQTSIGPEGTAVGYLRPETAQVGIADNCR
jgi:hypothetical protein